MAGAAAATGTAGAVEAARVERALRVRRREKKAATAAANMVKEHGEGVDIEGGRLGTIEIVRGDLASKLQARGIHSLMASPHSSQ